MKFRTNRQRTFSLVFCFFCPSWYAKHVTLLSWFNSCKASADNRKWNFPWPITKQNHTKLSLNPNQSRSIIWILFHQSHDLLHSKIFFICIECCLLVRYPERFRVSLLSCCVISYLVETSEESNWLRCFHNHIPIRWFLSGFWCLMSNSLCLFFSCP